MEQFVNENLIGKYGTLKDYKALTIQKWIRGENNPDRLVFNGLLIFENGHQQPYLVITAS